MFNVKVNAQREGRMGYKGEPFQTYGQSASRCRAGNRSW